MFPPDLSRLWTVLPGKFSHLFLRYRGERPGGANFRWGKRPRLTGAGGNVCLPYIHTGFNKKKFYLVCRFAEILYFVGNIIGMLEIGTEKTRVALMMFSDRTSVKFHLNRYNTTKELQDAVLLVQFPGGKTNVSGSLRVLIDSMYLPQNGGRSNAQRVSACSQWRRATLEYIYSVC